MEIKFKVNVTFPSCLKIKFLSLSNHVVFVMFYKSTYVSDGTAPHPK